MRQVKLLRALQPGFGRALVLSMAAVAAVLALGAVSVGLLLIKVAGPTSVRIVLLCMVAGLLLAVAGQVLRVRRAIASFFTGGFVTDEDREEGNEFLLRASSRGDSRFLAGTIDEVVVEANGFAPGDVDRQRLILMTPELRRAGNWLTIVRLPEEEPCGFITLSRSVFGNDHLEVGIWLGPTSRGRGLASRVIPAAGRIAFGHGYPHLLFGTTITNLAMRNALDRSGAHLIGETPHRLPNGAPVQAAWYRLTTAQPVTPLG